MSVSRYVVVELAAQVRHLLTNVPAAAAPEAQWADWHVRKAALLEMLGAVEPSLAIHTKDQASSARYEASRLSRTTTSPY
ncbi:hypothetical protein EV193_11635 [Herbihabitans rhizosphaerae]|uniref:Uncharacterized protein n=1 Tax=Herbihabitans rhizosphaerae TaxID=1872711 RepID=A0A4Q7KCY4_9PSEU|nr:hypothetical protein [Herbihabitans rhizosphaerae]RZS30515.1 hypothetical protein EV193_11635 [Herbihabitans rhizosphaerae]